MKTDFARGPNDLVKEKDQLIASLAALKSQYEIAVALFEKRNYSTVIKRRLADELMKTYGFSLRRACRLLQMTRTVYYYGKRTKAGAGSTSKKVRRVVQQGQNTRRSSFSLADDLFALRRGG